MVRLTVLMPSAWMSGPIALGALATADRIEWVRAQEAPVQRGQVRPQTPGAHEIGIRAALGALRRDVRRLMISRSMSWVLPGVVAGGALSAMALIASYLPARRATQVDPLIALRSESSCRTRNYPR